MLAYKIRSGNGTLGYQIMDAQRRTLGVYNLDGTPFTGTGGYSAIDNGGDPTIGCALPSWISNVFDPPPPPPPIPQEVSPYQARIALLNAGLLDTVNTLMSNPATPKAATIAWEYATAIERQSPFISTLAPALSLSDAQVDALFIAASQVVAN